MNWNFPNSQNYMAFTLKRILDGKSAVLKVVHDMQGDWQFLDDAPAVPGDASIVTLGEMVEFDPSLAELANLALGSQAVRKSAGGEWQISKI